LLGALLVGRVRALGDFRIQDFRLSACRFNGKVWKCSKPNALNPGANTTDEIELLPTAGLHDDVQAAHARIAEPHALF
jgi:hypothetical protein